MLGSDGRADKTQQHLWSLVKARDERTTSVMSGRMTAQGPPHLARHHRERHAIKEEVGLVGRAGGLQSGGQCQGSIPCACIQEEMLRAGGGRNRWPCTADATLLKRCFVPCPPQDGHSDSLGDTDQRGWQPQASLHLCERGPKAFLPHLLSAQSCLLPHLGAGVYLQALVCPQSGNLWYTVFQQQCSHTGI